MTQATPDALRFGTVGSPQTTPRPGTPAAIEHLRVLGLDHLEIAWVQSVRVSDETCAAICDQGHQHKVSLSIHAPYYINLNSQTVDLMKKSDERLLAAARKGFLSGARDIVFHPGSYHNQPPEQVYERAKEKLLEIHDILAGEEVDVILRPETMGKGAMFGTLDEVIQLSRDVPGVLPCVDFAHLHARTGNGGVNSYEEFDAIFAKFEAELGRDALDHFHAHMSGIAYTAKGESHHLPLNETQYRYRDLLQAFIDYNVRGSVAVEAPMPFHVADALTLQATYRRLLELKGDEDGGEDEASADES